MLDIHHGIRLLALVITCRRIDHQRAPCFFHIRVIMNGAHLTMPDILHLEVVHARLGNLDGTRPAAAAVERLAGWIGHRHTVDDQRIVVESWHLRLRRHRPCASLIFGHVVLRTAQVHLHLLRLRRAYGELHAVVALQLRPVRQADVRHRHCHDPIYLHHVALSLRCHFRAANGRQHRGQ